MVIADLVDTVLPGATRGKPSELRWQDEARIGQQSTPTQAWAGRGPGVGRSPGRPAISAALGACLRGSKLRNRMFDTYDAIADARCDALNWPMSQPGHVTSHLRRIKKVGASGNEAGRVRLGISRRLDLTNMGSPISGGIEQETGAMISFVIENMTCGGCAKGVTATVTQADPAAQVEVMLDSKRISVSGGRADGTTLLRALDRDGWQARAAT